MMKFVELTVLLMILCAYIWICHGKKVSQMEYLHQPPNAFKSSPGWQEPGFSRPTVWVLDRTFHDDNGTVIGEDRIFLRLKSDRSCDFAKQSNRPIFSWKPRRKAGKTAKSTGDIFDSENGSGDQFEERIKELNLEEDGLFSQDGAWWFRDEHPSSKGKFKLETREGKERIPYSYETSVEYGKIDGYAIKFQPGRILKMPESLSTKTALTSRGTVVGTFTIRVNINRPIISKDFQAFQ